MNSQGKKIKIHHQPPNKSRVRIQLMHSSSRTCNQWKKLKTLEQSREAYHCLAPQESLTLSSPAKSFVCKLTKVWEFSVMPHMNGQIIIFPKTWKIQVAGEKLVTPGKRTELTLREVRKLSGHRTQSKGPLQERNSPSNQELTWNNTLHRISGERAEMRCPDHTISHPVLFPLSFLQANKSEQRRATFLVLRGRNPPVLKK